MIQKSDHINELAAALSKAQAEIKGAKKEAENPFFKSKYADLESVWDACRVPLTKHGLSIAQVRESSLDGDYLVTLLMHSSGQWIAGKGKLTPVKNDPQSMGSCLSYSRRYDLAAILGIYQTDDDAEAAQSQYRNPSPVNNPPAATKALPGEYVIDFGKDHIGKKLSSFEPKELLQMVSDIDKWARKDGKQPTGKIKRFLDTANSYLDQLANAELIDGHPSEFDQYSENTIQK